jgi:citrate lyase subunit beta/citryl-CoA lyase
VIPRTSLSVPANSERKVDKARVSVADEVVLDLEDSIADDLKVQARSTLVATLADRSGWAPPRLSVRVNDMRSSTGLRDLMACAAAASLPASVVVPKVESPADLEYVDRLLDALESELGGPGTIEVQALIETPAGLVRVAEIAAASPRLVSLILGYVDLSAALGRSTHSVRTDDARWLPAQEAVLWAARSQGLAALDGPYAGIGDDDGLRQSTRWARDLGYDGKWVIHPAQIATVNEIFSPTASEIASAEATIAALSGDDGAVAVDGRMVDAATVGGALRLLARADRTR